MRINKFTKLKNGMYKLNLENDMEIFAHEELILKRGLLLKKDISDEDIKNIDKLNNNYNAYDIALKYISRKYRSCYDVYEYLLKQEIDKDIVQKVITKLKSQKYLDDSIFAKAFVNDKMKFSNNGPYKIRKELEIQKVDNSIIEETLKIFDRSLERKKLSKLVPKYVKTIKNKSYVMMKSKVCDYFSNLGYDKNLVIDTLKNINYDDSSSREKEYKKLYDKLSKKYSGEELEYKIKQAMYKKGYK